MKRVFALTACLLFLGNFLYSQQPAAPAQPKEEPFWNVDDIKEGMKGYGKSVVKGVKIEKFDAEVLGVLKNTSPGRDLILCRLSGMNLEKTGVIAGMSGSPVYVQNKLVGAVAYAWAYGKEPIAGITPFAQMRSFAAAIERREAAQKKGAPVRVGLASPVRIGGRAYDSALIADDFTEPQPMSADGLWLVPLKTPVMTSGMSPASLAVLREHFKQSGLVPMQAGGVSSNLPASERNIPLEAGGALTVALITGDFDMSAIGTVTQIEGKRVYGWGHPFMSSGECELPMMTGYVHTIFPRLTLSFKMGSPLQTVGVVNADVSTCVAGWLGREPDLLPVSATILREPDGRSHTYKVKVARLSGMIGSLVHAALTNSVDMEGNFPEEMSAHVKLRIDVEGHDPLLMEDWFSGPPFVGERAPQMLYSPVNHVLQMIGNNPFETLRIKSVECTTEVQAGRRSAEIEATELESDTVAPGGTLKAWVTLRPFKGPRQRIPLEVKIPVDQPEGSYTALIGDGLNNVRAELRDRPYLGSPQNLDHLMQAVRLQLAAKRTNLVLRVPVSGGGVAVNGKTLPDLPPSMVQILSSSRRTNVQTIYNALVARTPTSWVLQGADSLRFQVAKSDKATR